MMPAIASVHALASPAPLVLEAEQLQLHFGTVHALENVSLSIPAGQIVAILGPNGAGKSSLIALWLGLNRPSHGQVRVFGHSAGTLAVKRRLGVMLQQAELADNLKVSELIELFRHYYPEPMSQAELIQAAGLEPLQQRFYGKLSGGEKRRVQFALALAGNPDLLFLDEPTTGLDLTARRQLWEQIRRCAAQGRSVVLTTHYLEEAEQLAERIIVLNAGQVIADTTPQQLKQSFRQMRVRCLSQLNPQHSLWAELSTDSALQEFHQHSESQGLRIEFLSTAPEPLVRRLLASDPLLSELEITGAGLESAFLALTQSAASA